MVSYFLPRTGVIISLGFCCSVFTHTAMATEQSKVIDPVGTIGKLAFALVIVLAVFWTFARVLQHLQGFKNSLPNGLSIVGALSLGQRERVVVIQAGEEQIVLGVTSSQINTLHILDKPLMGETPSGNVSEFKDKLSDAMKKRIAEK